MGGNSETIGEKAERILVEGRLTVTRVSADAELARAQVVATCRGDHDSYVLGFDAVERLWRCTCPARRKCAHITALQLVTEEVE